MKKILGFVGILIFGWVSSGVWELEPNFGKGVRGKPCKENSGVLNSIFKV